MSFLNNLFGKKTYDIVLLSITKGNTYSKIKVVQELRLLKNLGLKEAKELAEAAPVVIASDVPAAEANKIKARFESAGAVVKLS